MRRWKNSYISPCFSFLTFQVCIFIYLFPAIYNTKKTASHSNRAHLCNNAHTHTHITFLKGLRLRWSFSTCNTSHILGGPPPYPTSEFKRWLLTQRAHIYCAQVFHFFFFRVCELSFTNRGLYGFYQRFEINRFVAYIVFVNCALVSLAPATRLFFD